MRASKEIDIRHLDQTYAFEIFNIHACCLPNTVGWSLENIERFFDTDTFKCFGAILHSKLIGFIAGTILEHEGEILSLAVFPDLQNKGIGKTLLKTFMAFFPNQTIFLEVQSNNHTAIRLYQNHGFSQMGYRKNYYGFYPDGARDALILSTASGNPGK